MLKMGVFEDPTVPIYFSGFLPYNYKTKGKKRASKSLRRNQELRKTKDFFGVSMIMPLISNHARDLGASPTVTGIIGSIYGTLQLFSSPVVGRWSDIKGRRYCLIWCLLLSAGGYFILGGATTLLLLFISRIPTGIFKHSQSVTKSYLADITPKEQQSAVLGRFNAASSIGFILGPMVGGNLAETTGGFYKVACVCGAMFVLNCGIVWLFLKDTNPEPHPGLTRDESVISLKKLGSEELNFGPLEFLVSFKSFDWAQMWDLFLVKFCLGFSVLIFRSNFSLQMSNRFDLSPSVLGYLISYSGFVSAICGVFVGWISQYYRNDAKLVYHMTALQTLTLFCIGYSDSFWIYFFFLTPLSFVTTVNRVAATSLTIQRGSGKEIGALLGFSQSVMSIARMLSPFLSGLALELSMSAPAYIGSVVTLAAVLLMTVRSQEPRENKMKQEK